MVVMDSQKYENLIAPSLKAKPNWHVEHVVSDALEAVWLVKRLQPDLVLLDIDLPRMNGIKAARRIASVAPLVRTICFSYEFSAGLAREVLRLGAWGFLVTERIPRDLVAAIEAVLQGRHFIDRKCHDVNSRDSGPIVLDRKDIYATLSLPSPQRNLTPPSHECFFYTEDSILLKRVSQFLESALTVGHSVVVCSTQSLREELRNVLESRGLDIKVLIEQGKYANIDASEILSNYVHGNAIQSRDLREHLGHLATRSADAASGPRPRVAFYQECALQLWAQGKEEATIQVEQLFQELAGAHDVDLLCAYSLAYVHGDEDSHSIQRICAQHSTVSSD